MTDRVMYDSLYSPSDNVSRANKTQWMDPNDVFADVVMPSPQVAVEEGYVQKDEFWNGVQQPATERKLIGALFSVSKSLKGEMFPIYEGENTIGRNVSNNICLLEATVEDVHAVLYATHEDYPDKDYVLRLYDKGSMYGTMVGGDEVFSEHHIVRDNDILLFGSNYQLLVKLFNHEEHLLCPSENFQAVEAPKVSPKSPEDELPPDAIPSIEFYTPSSKRDKQDNRTILY